MNNPQTQPLLPQQPTPIPAQAPPKEDLRKKFKEINGLLIPGGDQLLFFNSTFVQAAQVLYDLAIEANDNGTYFPIWGTCMGMQLIPILTSQNPSLLRRATFDSEDVSFPLHFSPAIFTSRLFGITNTFPDILSFFARENITANFHHDGYDPIEFLSDPKILSFYRLLATNVDKKNKPFVAAYEGKNYPIYGVEFHPETNQFSFAHDSVSHSPHAIRAVQYLANFFVNEARKNNQKFANPQEEASSLINHFPVSLNQGVYFFPPKF